MVHADRVAARIAILGEQTVETLQTVRTAVPHDVPLAAQLLVALQAREVFHVPSAALRFRTLVGQYNLRNVTAISENDYASSTVSLKSERIGANETERFFAGVAACW